MSYRIERLGTSHAPVARELFALFRKVFDDADTGASDLPDSAYIGDVLAKEGVVVLVALVGDRVVGGLTAYELIGYMKKEKEAYLYDLAVLEEFRRRGIARSLVTALRDYGRERGIRTIFVEANVEDADAVDFYRSLDAEVEDVKHFNIAIR